MTADLEVIEGGKAPMSSEPRTFDLTAEGAVLGNVLYDGRALAEVRERLRPEHFFSEAHRRIFEACLAMADAGTPIELATVATHLRASGRLGQVGDLEYLTRLVGITAVLMPRHLSAHARTIRDLWVRRQLGVFAQTVNARVERSGDSIETLLVEARARIDALTEFVAHADESIRIDAVAARVVSELMKRNAGGCARPTGFDRVDRLLAGLSDELSIVGARPGMGKTSFVTGVAVNVAKRGAGVYIASLETAEAPLYMRLACAEGRVDLQHARNGTMDPAEWARFIAASETLAKLPICLDTPGSMSARELWAGARRQQLQLAREGVPLEVVVVDYLQLLRPHRGGIPREQQVAEIARELKSLALELRVTVLACSQLNRNLDDRQDKRPLLSDLRESGELEQCARTIMFLYRDDYYNRGSKPKNGLCEVIVAKQNNGPTGTVRVGFEEPSTAFFNLDDREWR